MVWQCRSKHRMKHIYIPALVLYGFYLTHVVSVSPPHLMVVRSGENVTLQCINVLKTPGHVGWFKQVNSSEPMCITSMWSSLPTVYHQNGFQGKSMKMFMTKITIFLTITEVDVADSGLYFCGMFDNYFIFTNATVLKVQVADPQMRILVLLSSLRTGVLLCCLTIFIIIYLIRK
uniref:Ig-like domain-containing protein n=1 Tax=Salmo trutta TaxID=8032 RepID=A0A674ECW7_SALTR